MVRKQIIKNMLLFALWCAIGTGTIVLLVAAIQKKDAKKCIGVDINIKGVSNNFFVDKNDILNTIITLTGGKPNGKNVGSFNLREIEDALKKNIWVKNAQLFFDNNERLEVDVLEREPVARIFTNTGTTFYIDSSIAILPLSEKFSARLPVFTNFPSDKKILSKADSSLLRDMLTISIAIQADSFSMAMIDQIDITAQGHFEMIPKFGNGVIIFGDAKNAVEKLNRLRLFYKEVMVKAGWNKYSEINVQYSNQVVATRKGAQEDKADSLRTLQLIQIMADNAERLAGDSLQTMVPDNEHNTTSNNIILQSMERNDSNLSDNIKAVAPLKVNTITTKPVLPEPSKITAAKPAPVNAAKPAAVIAKKITSVRPVILKPAIKSIVKPANKLLIKPKQVMPKPLQKKVGTTVKQENEY